jgi:hypothetical protein
VIYTNISNVVDIFCTLHCLPPYNHLLKAAVDIILRSNYLLRVLHVPGERNLIADALSHICFSIALQLEPNLLDNQLVKPGLKTDSSTNEQSLSDKPLALLPSTLTAQL